MEEIYVVGHMTPDTDTIVSAMSLAAFLNAREKTGNYNAVITGSPNSETQYIFDRFKAQFPPVMENASGKKLFLVDHNEGSQIIQGWHADSIVGFVDHHKIKFECPGPIEITCRPWGSTNTIIYDLFKKENIEIPAELKPLMLCAMLSDTVILKSPTATAKDKEAIDKLSSELGLDYNQLGMEMFKAKAKVSEKSAEEIIKNDFKDFDMHGKKVGIGQIETPDLTELDSKLDELKQKLSELKQSGGYHTLVLMITDIIQEGSKLMVMSDETEKVAGIFNTKIENCLTGLLPGVMSRKKQVAPPLSEKL